MAKHNDGSYPGELDPEPILGAAAEAIPFVGSALYELTRDTDTHPALRAARVATKATVGTAVAAASAAEGAALGTLFCPVIGTFIGGVFGWFAGYTAVAKTVDAMTGE